ncbi:MAG: ABC transporter permease [Phycisphaeraceae bacterium]|nr:ABC transporter permease [Phycisphaeraceae bacterium]
MESTPTAPLRRVSAPVSVRPLLNPAAMAAHLWSLRGLFVQFTRREVAARHKGSVLGVVWNFLHPLMMLGVYTFVFAIVWQARWLPIGGDEGGRGAFALSVFAGLVMWEVFSGGVGTAPTIIVNNTNFVKKVIFPLEVLPLAQIGASAFVAGVSLLVLLAGNIALRGSVSPTLWLFPLVLPALFSLTAGLAWFVASLGVFLRDLRQIVSGLLLQVMFFMTPIFYPLERVPDPYQSVLRLNPMASIVDNARRTVLYGVQPDWASLGLVTLVGLLVMLLGYAFFMKSKRSFADVI